MSWKMTLKELLEGTRGEAEKTGGTEFTGVSTDGRVDNSGKIFFALKGEKYDAHDFIEQAVASKARAIVVHKPLGELKLPQGAELTVVRVGDTLAALQALGHFWRKKSSAKIVGITGTNGKTTTKEFTAQIIATKYPTWFSKGSFNNHFGVPISLLGLEPQHRVGIFEMGMNHPGELKQLVEIADPDVTVVTMVGRGHLEGMGSIEGVAQEKESVYRYARPDALRVFNLDNPHTLEMMSRAPKGSPRLTFSTFDAKADIHLKETMSTLDFLEISGRIGAEPGKARVPVFGRQNVNNIMAAAALAVACGVEADLIWKSLANLKTAWGRNQIVPLGSGARMIFDGYNANPESMGAIVENVSRLSVKGKKIFVLGEMLEMGETAGALHEELGAKVGESGADFVWFVGPHKGDFERGVRQTSFSKTLVLSDAYEEKLALDLARMLEPNDIVLVKGSRGMKLERVVSALDPQNFKTY
ncbi:MAG TPA: UDP-N-acetylmuramoyl-tripeptide--D-alanyl-D-alanine ligase [Bdellovibrionales bacterium]|nr:UDP-N-acetylmuramoyl-tripeptide--D-alanyl-D-alanine ligase [Bdellovibrionales bacterium]